MSERSFLDTNVLVYTDDRDSPEKQRAALALVARHRKAGTGVVSTQVLQEYFVAVTRKLGVATEIARRKIQLFAHLHLVEIGLDDILGAVDLHRLHGFSLWDALIVRAAHEAGCKVLLTEDLQSNRRIGNLEVRNPFS